MPEATTQLDDPWSAGLWERFVTPGDEDRLRAWWHWMDGNIDPAGIVRDLTWLHSVGVRGVQMFEVAPVLTDKADLRTVESVRLLTHISKRNVENRQMCATMGVRPPVAPAMRR